jgi:hypothetical protein
MALLAGVTQGIAHGSVHVAGDGVLLVATADLDGDDAVVVADEDVGVGHGQKPV